MKKIAIVTLFPEMFESLTDYGITGRACKDNLIELNFYNPRDFTEDKHQTVDDRPYGGGPGMVMKIEPLKEAVDQARRALGNEAKVIYLSPQGQVLKQSQVEKFALTKEYEKLIFIAGRYEGIDERFLQTEVDEEWSVGDYVLSGGELPTMVLLDAMIRLLPSALGHKDSAEQDSFSGDKGLLDCPHYTRPEDYQGKAVPEVLMSGNHKEIAQWRLKQSLGRTWQRRPELLESLELSAKDVELLEAFKCEVTKKDTK
jgi:tRNA (guanine37-N1)-methyltransferase